MASLVFDKAFLSDFAKLDLPIQKKVEELPDKFAHAVHAGVHLEKLNAAADDRVRTVRVDQFWRGVVVALGNARYALLRVLPHDKAIHWASRQKLAVNPVTGIIELIDIPTVTEQLEAVTNESNRDEGHLFCEVPDKAFKQLGVSEELIPLLRRIRGEMELYAIATFLPKAQGDAVLLLADGKSPEEAWAAIAADYAVENEDVDAEDIDAALQRAGTKAEFIVATSDKELRELLAGDFEAWRTFLHPTQRLLAEKPVFNGPAKVTGGAGTGKTVVAIHRARFLAQRMLDEGDATGRILVATYTNSLARNLDRTLKSFCAPQEYKCLHVSTVDSLAYQTLAADGVKLQPARSAHLRKLADKASAIAGLDEHDLDGRFLVAEWSHVILARKITSLPEYANSPRPGRGRPLARKVRKAVWEAVRHLSELLTESHLATYHQIADRAVDALVARGTAPYQHVVVDEAQDLHPAQWRLLRVSVDAGANDLFIVGDANQRIYDSRVSLAGLGIETRGRSRRLKINYRTSQQILGWALGILTDEPIDDLDGNAESQVGYRSEFQGPLPEIRSFDTAVEEAQFVADTIRGWRGKDVAATSIGVVARTNDDVLEVKRALEAHKIAWSELGAEGGGTGVFIGTMHSSKGLEFARICVVGVSADRIPLPFAVTSVAQDPSQHRQDLLRERCLLYVACTRARDALCVTSVGPLSTFAPSVEA